MSLSRYMVLFVIYSLFGWIYESTYCSIKGSKWENRGFLFGPIVPIYGAGALLATFVFVDLNVFGSYNPVAIFISCYLGSIVLEFTTSYVLEKMFHAKWWDYSDKFCNIQGRICLPYSIAFGLAGLVCLKWIIPPVVHVVDMAPSVLIEFIALLFALLIGMDLSLTVSALTSFAKNFERMNAEINAKISEKFDALEENKDELVEKLTAENIESYIKSISGFTKGRIASIQTIKVNSSKKEEGFAAIMEKGKNAIIHFREEKKLAKKRNKSA